MTYAYDAVNRLLSKTPDPSLGEPTVSFTYTPTGQRATMVDASGTTTYTYDARDRLLSKATPQGTLTYTYDLAGTLRSIESSNTNGVSVAYAYDALNRLATVTDNRLTNGVTTYSYDLVGNLASYVYPNGAEAVGEKRISIASIPALVFRKLRVPVRHIGCIFTPRSRIYVPRWDDIILWPKGMPPQQCVSLIPCVPARQRRRAIPRKERPHDERCALLRCLAVASRYRSGTSG